MPLLTFVVQVVLAAHKNYPDVFFKVSYCCIFDGVTYLSLEGIEQPSATSDACPKFPNGLSESEL